MNFLAKPEIVVFQRQAVNVRLVRNFLHDRRLHRRAGVPLQGITCTHEFGLHAAKDALPGMAVDAQGALGGVIGSQIDRLGGG